LDECASEEIWATIIIVHPSKNDLPVGHKMNAKKEEISPILRFPLVANDGTTSGKIRKRIAPNMTKAEIQGNKR
jgi:hypothetical protein